MTSTACSRQWFPAHIQKHDGTKKTTKKQKKKKRLFAEFPENEKYHVSYLSILVANIFSNCFLSFDEVFVLKSNITTYLIETLKQCHCSYSESRLTAYSHFMLSKDLDRLMFGTKGIFIHSGCLCYKV